MDNAVQEGQAKVEVLVFGLFAIPFVIAAMAVGALEDFLHVLLQLTFGVLLSGVFTWVINRGILQIADNLFTLALGWFVWMVIYTFSVYWGFRLGRRLRQRPFHSH